LTLIAAASSWDCCDSPQLHASKDKGAQDGWQAHRKVQGEDSDVVRQQHVQGLLCVSPAAAVAVAVDDHWRRGQLGRLQPEVAALQLQPVLVDLSACQCYCQHMHEQKL
jgi:hypothetical protein